MRVFVYWNLHKGGYSIKALEGPSKGKVIAHASDVSLWGCVFKVSEPGRVKSAIGPKFVHAGVQGRLSSFKGTLTPAGEASGIADWTIPWDNAHAENVRSKGVTITYNPRRWSTFVRRADETPIHAAHEVVGSTTEDRRANMFAL